MHQSVASLGACTVRYFLRTFLQLDTACADRDERSRLLRPAPGVMIRDVPKPSGQRAMGVPAEDAVRAAPHTPQLPAPGVLTPVARSCSCA